MKILDRIITYMQRYWHKVQRRIYREEPEPVVVEEVEEAYEV